MYEVEQPRGDGLSSAAMPPRTLTSPTLETFVREARERVAAGYYDVPAPLRPSAQVSLARAIHARAGRAVLAEIKPASPTQGPLRADVDAGALAKAYVKAGAVGVSVLAEKARFGGSLANVASAAKAGAPVLFKDFVVDERQLDAARRCHASAVLLILDSVADPALTALIEQAHARDLEVLLEVYDGGGLDRALATRADLIGVNNRDLREPGLPIDLTATPRALEGRKPDRPVLALSGVASAQDARSMFQAGATAILVGSALMRADEPARELATLIGELP